MYLCTLGAHIYRTAGGTCAEREHILKKQYSRKVSVTSILEHCTYQYIAWAWLSIGTHANYTIVMNPFCIHAYTTWDSKLCMLYGWIYFPCSLAYCMGFDTYVYMLCIYINNYCNTYMLLCHMTCMWLNLLYRSSPSHQQLTTVSQSAPHYRSWQWGEGLPLSLLPSWKEWLWTGSWRK